MKKFVGKEYRNCYGHIDHRPQLAERAAYFGWELEPVIGQNTIGEPLLEHYVVKVASTGEVVVRETAGDLSGWLAGMEEAEVRELMALMPDGWTLIEVEGKHRSRAGFAMVDDDLEPQCARVDKPATFAQALSLLRTLSILDEGE